MEEKAFKILLKPFLTTTREPVNFKAVLDFVMEVIGLRLLYLSRQSRLGSPCQGLINDEKKRADRQVV